MFLRAAAAAAAAALIAEDAEASEASASVLALLTTSASAGERNLGVPGQCYNKKMGEGEEMYRGRSG